MINPTQYIFVNDSLELGFGKAAAQIAHAQEELTWEYLTHHKDQLDDYREILETNPRTVIVLACPNAETMYKIANYVESINLLTGIYVDECGENYILEPTAMAIEYVEKDDPRLTPLFSKFELYKPERWAEETMYLMASINGRHKTDGGRWRELENCIKREVNGRS